MKNTEMLLAMNLIEDKYIEEAAPRRRNIRFRRAMIAVAAIFFSLLLFLFIPYNTRPPSVREYRDSEYYPLIKKLNEYNFEKPIYANNFDMILSTVILASKEKPQIDMPEDTVGSESVEFNDSTEYTEDNVPSGIIEGDIIASNGKYIFRSGSIYLMDGENSKKIYYFDFPDSGSDLEMYMSSDGETLIGVFTNGVPIYRDPDAGDYKKLGTAVYTEIVALDVTDPKNVRAKARVTVTGKLLKSAYTDGRLIVASSYEQKIYPIDFSDPSTFVPMIATERDSFIPLPPSSIIAPEKLSSSRYTVLTMLGEDDLSVLDCKAFLSESSDIYIAEDSIYMTRTLSAEEKRGDYTHISPYTVITRVSYAENVFDRIGAVTLKGRVNSHNFLSQQGGLLYAVTETVTAARHDKFNIYACCECLHRTEIIYANAAVYRIDTEKMELLDAEAELCVGNLRPQSVVYSGGYATLSLSDLKGKGAEYISVRLSDFAKSSSDTETKRPTALLDLGGGYYVTVYCESERVLVETKTNGKVVTNVYETVVTGTFVKVCEQTADGLREVASHLIEKAEFSSVYNNEDFVFIDSDLGLIGFAIQREQYEDEDPDDYDADGYPEFSDERYALLQFKDGNLSLIADFAHSGSYESARAILSDGWIYVTSEKTLTAVPVNVSE